MADYSTIKGFTVQTLATDPSAPGVAGAAWSSGGALGTGVQYAAGAGTLTAGLVISGADPTKIEELRRGIPLKLVKYLIETEKFEKAGMKSTGINPESNLVEIVEITNHPWFVGVQFHPEFKSTVSTPHPLFIYFIKACLNQRN